MASPRKAFRLNALRRAHQNGGMIISMRTMRGLDSANGSAPTAKSERSSHNSLPSIHDQGDEK